MASEEARLRALAAAVRPGPWWMCETDEGVYVVTMPPVPWDPAAGQLPGDGGAVTWRDRADDPRPVSEDDEGDEDDEDDWRPDHPAEVDVGFEGMARLAAAARDALPALLDEVVRLRAALAAIVAKASQHPEPIFDEGAQGWRDAEGHYLGEDGDVDFGGPEAWAEAAQMARAALGEAVRDGE